MREEFMKLAVDLAIENVVKKNGGPFGAVIVKDGIIVGIGQNQVTAMDDPTAHAEIQAIRAACKYLNSYQLLDCELYTSCEPCPMCFGAIYWARLKKVYYGCTSQDAAQIGFEDQYIYNQLYLPPERRAIPMIRILTNNLYIPFNAWLTSSQKKNY